MKVYREVYTALYYKLAEHYASNILKNGEGLGKNGKKYKLKSQNIWNVTRIENGTKFYLVSLITGDISTSYWIYYRLLTNYESKSPQIKSVVGEYQDIQGLYITSALRELGYSTESNLIDGEVGGTCDTKTALEVEGELLMQKFVEEHYPYLIKYLCYESFDPTQNSGPSTSSHESLSTGDTGLAVGNFSAGWQLDAAKQQVIQTTLLYLKHISLSKFDAAFLQWSKPARRSLFFNSPAMLELYYSDKFIFQDPHFWNFNFHVDKASSLRVDFNFHFVEPILLPGELKFIDFEEYTVWSTGHRNFYWHLQRTIGYMGDVLWSDNPKDIQQILLERSKDDSFMAIFHPNERSTIFKYYSLKDSVCVDRHRLLTASLEKKGNDWKITELEVLPTNQNYSKVMVNGY